MTRKQYKELIRKINTHFYNEGQLIKHALEADLTEEEWKKVTEFMLNHPLNEVTELFQRNKALRESRESHNAHVKIEEG